MIGLKHRATCNSCYLQATSRNSISVRLIILTWFRAKNSRLESVHVPIYILSLHEHLGYLYQSCMTLCDLNTTLYTCFLYPSYVFKPSHFEGMAQARWLLMLIYTDAAAYGECRHTEARYSNIPRIEYAYASTGFMQGAYSEAWELLNCSFDRNV